MNSRQEICYQLFTAALLIAAVICTWGSAAFGNGPPPLAELIDRVQEQYDGTTDIRASFVQESFIATLGRTIREEGVVFIKKPSCMVWDYQHPAPKKLVVNPEKAWLYIPADNMVYVQDSRRILTSKITLRFLAGIGKFTEDFTITYAEPAVDAAGQYGLILTPADYAEGIKTLRLTVEDERYRVIRCRFTDLYDNTTDLSLENIETNTGLPDPLFSFTPPPGAEVYEVP
ncbi:MAG: outer membrane lipoprotein carrier protein LolA [Deltaproteobacteria bacterium]|nr:outer membrane lipoprotein carrier protein LolA [Deltaproteobacteria bacterium]